MILPTTLALSLLTLTRALPLSSHPSSSSAELDVSGSWRYPSFLPSLSDIQQDSPPLLVKRSISLNVGDEGLIVLDTSSSSSDDDSLQEGSSFAETPTEVPEEEEDVFNPDDYSAGKAVVRNPKAILNPKNPNYSASLAALQPKPTTTTTTTTSAAVQTPTQASTFKGEATYFFQNGVAGACKFYLELSVYSITSCFEADWNVFFCEELGGKVNPDSAFIVALDYRLVSSLSLSLYLSLSSLLTLSFSST